MSLFKGEFIFTPRIVGAVDGVNAKAGHVGEVVSSLVPVGSAVSLTNATPANVTSIPLTAGDWNIEGTVNFTAAAATTAAGAAFAVGVNTTSATVPTDGSETYEYLGAITTGTYKATGEASMKTLNVTANTTVYLVASAAFSAGTVGAYGSLIARRVR